MAAGFGKRVHGVALALALAACSQPPNAPSPPGGASPPAAAGSLHGVVRDATDEGAPVAGARVSVSFDGGIASATTSA